VIFFEPKRRYWEKAEVDLDLESQPLHTSRVVRPGSALTLVGYGPVLKTCLEAATAAEADGQDLEVIDLRTLSPLDLGPVYDSVRRTGRLVVVAEAPSEVSVAAEVAAKVQERCFHSLEAPVLRVTGFDTPYPPSKCEDEYLPDLDRVLDAVDRSLAW
jgi:2-oxoisovalerate dehydrogenase E1 component beta subunit